MSREDSSLAASMDLLTAIQRNALEPDYLRERPEDDARGQPASRLVGVVLATGLLAMAAAQTSRSAPSAQAERAELIARVRAAQDAQEQKAQRIAALDAEVSRLQASNLASAAAPDQDQAIAAGRVPVSGPGIVLDLDDAQSATHGAEPARVTDQDLRRLVNGLWLSGAEAIAVNGHRITARTAIRQAGSAITVDYRSLTHPYRVEAIGDPRQLGSRLAASPAGQWWSFLKDNYGLSYQVTTADDLGLPADPGLGVVNAQVDR